MDGIDADGIGRWLAARSVARGLPAPVAVPGGWRVDTAAADEEMRFLFLAPGPEVTATARAHARPRVPLKLCAAPEVLAALLPAGWPVARTGWVMVRDGAAPPPLPLPAGFTIAREQAGERTTVRLHAGDGTLAARGHAAEHGGVFVYDRIAVEPPFRRRGLGRALMAALAATRRAPQSRELLVATDAGRALYETIGWRTVAPYATAVRPEAGTNGKPATPGNP